MPATAHVLSLGVAPVQSQNHTAPDKQDVSHDVAHTLLTASSVDTKHRHLHGTHVFHKHAHSDTHIKGTVEFIGLHALPHAYRVHWDDNTTSRHTVRSLFTMRAAAESLNTKDKGTTPLAENQPSSCKRKRVTFTDTPVVIPCKPVPTPLSKEPPMTNPNHGLASGCTRAVHRLHQPHGTQPTQLAANLQKIAQRQNRKRVTPVSIQKNMAEILARQNAKLHTHVGEANTSSQPCHEPTRFIFDRDDRCITKDIFEEVQIRLGRTFNLDCCANESGDNALCASFCHVNNSFDTWEPKTGTETLWCNAPFGKMEKFLCHYEKLKRANPGLSACFLVPEWKQHNWHKRIRTTWAKIRHFDRGSRIFHVPTQSGRGMLPHGTPWPCEIYYDPPWAMSTLPEYLCVGAKPTHSLSLQLDTRVGNTHANTLIDTGASAMAFCTPELCERAGITILPHTENIVVGGDHTIPIMGTASLPIQIQQYRADLPALVLPLPDQIDIILGDAWLVKNNAYIDYVSKTCCLRRGKRATVLRTRQPETVRRTNKHKHQTTIVRPDTAVRLTREGNTLLISGAACRRAARSGADVVLCVIQPSDDGSLNASSSLSGDANLPPHLRAKLEALLAKYEDRFADSFPEPRDCRIPAVIPIQPGSKPANRPAFRYSDAERTAIEQEITDLLSRGLIERSCSPFGAPVIFVRKKDGRLRMCVDYRALNSITIRNSAPLPRIDDLFDQLHGAAFFTSLDLTSGYHQIRLPADDQHKTAFKTPQGLFQYRVLPFGLANAPSVFQSYMNQTFAAHIGKCAVIYLDDVLIYSRTAESHLEHLETILSTVRQAGLFLKKSKCDFFKTQLKFLGHILDRQGVHPDPDKIKTVMEWPTPSCLTELRSFLGLCNYFRKFVKGYSARVGPLLKLLRGESTFPAVLTKEQMHAFHGIKHDLCSAPVLVLPQRGPNAPPFEVVSDASQTGCGAVLLQQGKPVSYLSKKFNPAQMNYDTTERELLGVITALNEWRCYLDGNQFTVVTDHQPNLFFASRPLLSRRQARWSLFLSTFNFKWEFRAGKQNMADPLSRVAESHLLLMIGQGGRPVQLPCAPSTDQSVSTACWGRDELVAGYGQDPAFEKQPEYSYHNQLYWKEHRLVLPAGDWRTEFITHAHDTPWGGHRGVTATLAHLESLVFWPGMRQDVIQHVKNCGICAMGKPNNSSSANAQPMPVPFLKWETISLDFITGLPRTPSGFDSILTIVDKLSKYSYFIARKTTDDAVETARIVHDRITRDHGFPQRLICDRDTLFTSEFWQHYHRLQGTAVVSGSAYHCQTDGQTERHNRKIEQYLRCMLLQTDQNWDELLPMAQLAINNTYNDAVKAVPAVLMHGCHALTPDKVKKMWLQNPRLASATPVQFFNEVAETMASSNLQALQSAREYLIAAQNRMLAVNDKGRAKPCYQIGDRLLLNTKNLRFKEGKHKLMPKWIGPFIVLRKHGPCSYELDLPTKWRVHRTFHTSLLRKFPNQSSGGPPIPEIIDGQAVFEVASILDTRLTKHTNKADERFYRVRWAHHGPEFDTWEPADNLVQCEEVLKEFWQARNNAAERQALKERLEKESVTITSHLTDHSSRATRAERRAKRQQC